MKNTECKICSEFMYRDEELCEDCLNSNSLARVLRRRLRFTRDLPTIRTMLVYSVLGLGIIGMVYSCFGSRNKSYNNKDCYCVEWEVDFDSMGGQRYCVDKICK